MGWPRNFFETTSPLTRTCRANLVRDRSRVAKSGGRSSRKDATNKAVLYAGSGGSKG